MTRELEFPAAGAQSFLILYQDTVGRRYLAAPCLKIGLAIVDYKAPPKAEESILSLGVSVRGSSGFPKRAPGTGSAQPGTS